MFLLHGSLVKFSVCRTKIALTHSRECLDHPGLVNITGQILLFILQGLGLSLPTSHSFVMEVNRLMQVVYNYKLPLETIRDMMEDLDNSGLTRKKKKLEFLVFQLSKQKVVLEREELESLEECSQQLEIFSSTFEANPRMFLPVFQYFPSYILQRKRIYKNVSKVQQKLCEILNGKVKNYTADVDENIHQLFFVIFIFLHISRTVFTKQRVRGVQKKSACEQHVNLTDDVVTPLTAGLTNQMREFTHHTPANNCERPPAPQQRRKGPSSTYTSTLGTDPEEIIVVSEEKNAPSYDICGLRFFLARNCLKIDQFDLPQGCLIVYYSTE